MTFNYLSGHFLHKFMKMTFSFLKLGVKFLKIEFLSINAIPSNVVQLVTPILYFDILSYWDGTWHHTVLFCLYRGSRDEQDFGLETETETRVVSVSVSCFETKASKSQS